MLAYRLTFYEWPLLIVENCLLFTIRNFNNKITQIFLDLFSTDDFFCVFDLVHNQEKNIEQKLSNQRCGS